MTAVLDRVVERVDRKRQRRETLMFVWNWRPALTTKEALRIVRQILKKLDPNMEAVKA